jgi:hypothetical protein
VPEIVDTARRLLDKVWSGELGNPPDGQASAGGAALVRAGWL